MLIHRFSAAYLLAKRRIWQTLLISRLSLSLSFFPLILSAYISLSVTSYSSWHQHFNENTTWSSHSILELRKTDSVSPNHVFRMRKRAELDVEKVGIGKSYQPPTEIAFCLPCVASCSVSNGPASNLTEVGLIYITSPALYRIRIVLNTFSCRLRINLMKKVTHSNRNQERYIHPITAQCP